ncbi:Oidioi.mRNA.OKI2018_I69.chr2.g5506.t1.cds [Oikopleura dioica]|uniref:Oidioi.mRNA.OKI2018_I69.chr2.g5506.t1.cds n=1 Tax=Oikopleura dioica TaxID=34765 RepID=A0ABN7T0M5_OIKDI|nr:Oidioi.mRNA.OKI2018_I69.chr2.g5506.t1.cds [Oikopleura dioica]
MSESMESRSESSYGFSKLLENDVIRIEDDSSKSTSAENRAVFSTLFLPKISVEEFYGKTIPPKKLELCAKRDFENYKKCISRSEVGADLLLKKIAIDNLKLAIDAGMEEEVAERMDRLRPLVSNDLCEIFENIAISPDSFPN